MKTDRTMNRNAEHRNEEVKRTLELLDALPNIDVGTHFRTRLMRRIESAETRTQGNGTLVVAFNPRIAFLAFLLVLNLASAMFLFIHTGTSPTSGTTNSMAESFGEDYGGAALSYYDDGSALD